MTKLFFKDSVCLQMSGCGLAPEPSNIKVTKQSAEGLTQSSFDQGYLQYLVDEYQQGAEQSLQRRFDRSNIPRQERDSKATANGHADAISDDFHNML